MDSSRGRLNGVLVFIHLILLVFLLKQISIKKLDTIIQIFSADLDFL